MIKYCEKDEQTCRDIPPTSSVMKTPDILTKDNEAQGANEDMPPPLSPDGSEPSSSISEPPPHSDNQDKLDNSLSTVSSPPSISSTTDFQQIPYPHIHVAAIDNGLAFPFKHPDQWRSYPYGWLYLSESLVGQPFTANTRNHFLPMLSNPKWWKETVNELRRLFASDADFEPGMFAKQMAVLKGQGWNIVETLKQPNQGPLDLCARQNMMVWDDVKIIEIPSEINIINRNEGISTANDEDLSSSVDGYFPAPPPPRRSLSEDNSGRASFSTSAPSSSQRWRDKLKEKFNFDSSGKNKDTEEKKTKRVIIERLEPVKGGAPFFTFC
jgi:phosphatidylinositol 4-kinase type 2